MGLIRVCGIKCVTGKTETNGIKQPDDYDELYQSLLQFLMIHIRLMIDGCATDIGMKWKSSRLQQLHDGCVDANFGFGKALRLT